MTTPKSLLKLAVCYVRSSKDRADVSLDAQRRELHALADAKGLSIIGEFSDAVESAKDEDRPGFQKLLRELDARDRRWTYLLVVDTSRLSRARYFATVFKHNCKKLGITILYSKMPAGDPITDELLEGFMEVIDQYHSRMSKAKGMAGMRENLSNGHRAGGRAPFGYRLVHEASGAMRDGEPVLKSRLEPNDDAPAISAYLKERAAGVARRRAKEKSGVTLKDTTLIGIEWNALTYAGHTIWGVHAERLKGGYAGGTKRRPREEWVINEGTHAPLIHAVEAEAVLAQVDRPKRTRARVGPRVYLLAGLIQAPDGTPWYGDRGNYRAGKGRKVSAERIERAILEALAVGLQSPAMVDELHRRIVASYAQDADDGESKALDARLRDLTRSIDRVSALLVETTAPAALLRSIEVWEAERTLVLDRKLHLEERARGAARMRNVRPADVRRLLKHLAEDLESRDRSALKDALARLIQAVELDPETLACTMRYQIAPMNSGGKLASPRDYELIPPFERDVSISPNRQYIRRVA
jgi:DNA invertase Pin-like site-specific DNA recombinase